MSQGQHRTSLHPVGQIFPKRRIEVGIGDGFCIPKAYRDFKMLAELSLLLLWQNRASEFGHVVYGISYHAARLPP